MRWLRSPACVLAAALSISGCGYRLKAGPARMPEQVRSVWAPIFVNRTSEPGLEVIFTQAFREQLIRAGVEGGEASEARAEGEIQGVGGFPTIGGPSGRLASYRLSATVLVRLKKGDRVLSEAVVTGNEDYPPGADVLQSEANRMAALRRLSESLMRDAVARLASGW